jgi:hypothetical protein
MKTPQTEAQRRHAIAWAIALTADTPLAPQQYEADLLEQYAQGSLTLDQIIERLDSRVQHVLYRSKARQPMSPDQLTELLEESRTWNEQHQITGLLCYSSDGHFVQVIEGPAAEVNELFARIRQDTRHYSVTALSQKASSTRWFADWKMALVQAEPAQYYWLIGYLEARGHNLVVPQMPIADPLLATLLESFSKA